MRSLRRYIEVLADNPPLSNLGRTIMTLFPTIDHQYLSQTVFYNLILDTDVQNVHMKCCSGIVASRPLLPRCSSSVMGAQTLR